MSDRINPAEQEEALHILQRQNTEAIALVGLGTDVELEELRGDLNALIDIERIQRMTADDLRRLRVIDQNLTAILANPAAIQNYPYDEARADTRFMIEFYLEPLKSEFQALYDAYTPELHQQLLDETQAIVEARIARREGQGQALEQPDETPGLGLRRVEMLAAPDLNIGRVVQTVRSEIESEGLSNEQAMQRFRSLLVPNVLERLTAWASSNDDVVRLYLASQGDGSPTGDSEAQILENLTGITTVGESVAGDVFEGAGNLLGNLGGDINSALSYHFIEEDPLLGQLFNTEQSKTPLMRSLFSGDFDATLFTEHISEQLVDLFPDNLEFGRITEQFGAWTGFEDRELTVEDLEQIQEKLETIPRFFVGGTWADQYHDYVRNEVGGRGALDFPEWLLTQVDGLQKLFFSILVNPMVVTAMDWWYSEDGETDADRYGNNWAEYEALKENAPDERGGLREDVVPPGDVGAGEEELIRADENYGNLLSQLRETLGEEATLDLRINGEALTPENLSANTEFQALLPLAADPSRAPLLTLGVEIADALFVVERIGNQSGGEGINFYFEDGGIQMSYDLDNAPFLSWIDEIGGAGAGLAVAAFLAKGGVTSLAFGPPGWVVGGIALALGGLIGGIANFGDGDGLTYLLDGESFSFDDFSPTDFHAHIQAFQEHVGAIEEAFTGITPETVGPYIQDFENHQDKFDFDNIQTFPPEMFSENGISPAFMDLLGLPDEFWDGYQMNQRDLTAFGNELDTGWFNFGSISDREGAIALENDWIFNDGGYEINGSGWLWDTEVHTAQEFFAWLHS